MIYLSAFPGIIFVEICSSGFQGCRERYDSSNYSLPNPCVRFTERVLYQYPVTVPYSGPGLRF